MKCVKYIGPIKVQQGRIERVANSYAMILVESGSYEFCPKHEWKQQRLEDDRES